MLLRVFGVEYLRVKAALKAEFYETIEITDSPIELDLDTSDGEALSSFSSPGLSVVTLTSDGDEIEVSTPLKRRRSASPVSSPPMSKRRMEVDSSDEEGLEDEDRLRGI